MRLQKLQLERQSRLCAFERLDLTLADIIKRYEQRFNGKVLEKIHEDLRHDVDPKDAVDAATGMRKQITDHLTALKSCKDDDIGDMIRESQTTVPQFAAQVAGCQDTQDRLTTQLEEIRIESK